MGTAFFLVTGGSTTIKHRCVTHLYGSNAIERVGSWQRAVEKSEDRNQYASTRCPTPLKCKTS